jgi:CubicO group peptidase (beta-lactamase class C family)
VSKLLTTLAIGLLYQEGKWDLDAPIQKYLPDFPEKKYPITSRQLAGHTAGIRHYRNSDPVSIPRRYKSVQEGLSIFKDDSLLFKPGTAYAYSTFGYCLLSAVAEAVSHTDFLSFMRDSIFLRLDMRNTIADYSDSIVPGRVRFYEHSNGRLVNAALVDNSYKWAGGGFLSTPTDLVNMTRGLLNHTLLHEKTTELLFTSQHLENGKDIHVGIGWRIDSDSKGRRIIHHGGTIDGGRTFLLLYPDQGMIVAIAANMSGVNINLKEAENIAGYFLTPLKPQ